MDAKLRDHKTDDNIMIMLQHGNGACGVSGRFARFTAQWSTRLCLCRRN